MKGILMAAVKGKEWD
jgi:plasmid maintenance system antidote protein VapI